MTPTLVSPFDENSKSLANELLSATTDQAYADNEAAIVNSNNTVRETTREKEMAMAMSEGSEMIRFESYNVGGMDVVSKAEAEAIGQRAAKQARAQVYRDLKNKPGARAGVGI